MTFLKTTTECLYSYANASTNLATFTTEDNLQKTYPPVQLVLPLLLKDVGDTGKSFKVKATGQLGSTATPTFQWSARLLTSTTWSAGGILLGTSAALTTQTTVTLGYWFLDLDIIVRTLSIGAASTVVSVGSIYSPFGLATATNGGGTIPASNVAPTVATVDNSLTYYLFLSAACSASSGSNLINTQQLKLYCEN